MGRQEGRQRGRRKEGKERMGGKAGTQKGRKAKQLRLAAWNLIFSPNIYGSLD